MNRRGKILFIDAKNEVTRKNSFSYLEDKHIEKIANAYHEFKDIDGFAKVVDIADVQKSSSKLSIPLYVVAAGAHTSEVDGLTVDEQYNVWNTASNNARSEIESILDIVGGKTNE